MTIRITPEQAQMFLDNGFSKDKVQASIEHYRSSGLTDDEIQTKINDRLNSFANSALVEAPEQPQETEKMSLKEFWSATPEERNEQRKAIGRERLQKRQEWEQKHPIISGIQKDFEPGYRRELIDMQNQAEYGSNVPLDVALKSNLKGAGLDLIPAINWTVGLGTGNLGATGNLANIAKGQAIQNAIQGGTEGLLGGLADTGSLVEAGKRGLTGAGLGATLGATIPVLGNKIGQPIKNAIENSNVQNTITSALEALTSVPQKYSKLALSKELAGESIFNKPFEPETAYQGIERKLNLAKSVLPNKEYFAESYNKLGQRAKEGIEKIKASEGHKLNEALKTLENKEIDNKSLQSAIDGIIESYGSGGVYNSALAEAPQIVQYLQTNLHKKGLTYRDLDRIKNRLYDMGYSASQNREGTAAEVARTAAEQINNYLRRVSPAYAQPNDALSMVHNLERDLGSLSGDTIAKKLPKYGEAENLIGGTDRKLKNVNDILPLENEFLKDAQKLSEEQAEIDNIQKLISSKYTKNPKLLANITDEATEQALNDLQAKTGVEFMDELQETRARDLLEKIAPGQGGGSGSEQGFFNNVVRPIISGIGRGAGGALVGSTIGGPLGAVAGLAAVSPKIMAKGTIKNLGNLYRGLEIPTPSYIPRLMTIEGLNMLPLQGGVEYNDYR